VSRRPVALISGLLFAIGLALAGMTRPSKIVGFLDFAGAWDPSLLLVMVGAIAVFATAYWSSRRMQKPIANDAFAHPTTAGIDARLIVGASIFGIGWGLSGFCPGPAIAALGAGVASSALFVPAMLAGLWLTRLVTRAD
jgi:uncharacterized membrane protein YedE/YeeE